jgi:hypothetical protein
MKKHRGWLVCLLSILITSVAFSQVIKIRVVDIKNERPLANRSIALTLLYDKGERTPDRYDGLLRAQTDSKGEAQFRLPEPAPTHLSAQVGLGSDEHWRCGCNVLFETQEAVEKGIVGPRPGPWSKKKVTSVKVVPAEIVILARPWTLFERILAPLLRG